MPRRSSGSDRCGGPRPHAQQRDRQRRQVGGQASGALGTISARRARAREAAASAAKREGAAPMRAGTPSARRAAASTPSSVAAVQAAQAVGVEPGDARARPDSTAAPIASSAHQHRSHASATPGRVGRDEPQRRTARERLAEPQARRARPRPRRPPRPRRSATRAPARAPAATGPAASASRPPAATVSAKRGSRTQTIITNICSHQGGREQVASDLGASSNAMRLESQTNLSVREVTTGTNGVPLVPGKRAGGARNGKGPHSRGPFR